MNPGGERGLKVRWPALGQWNQIGTGGCGLLEGGAIRAEHVRILAAVARKGMPPGDWFAVGTGSAVVGVATAELDAGGVSILADTPGVVTDHRTTFVHFLGDHTILWI